MNIYYDVEDNHYRTYPDGDIATIDQMRELIENKNFSIAKLQKENKILKENAEHNDKVVDKVNWENMLLKKENKQLKDNWNKLREYIKETKLKEFEKDYGKRYGETFTQAEIVVCNMIMNKMLELEGSDSK